MRRYLPFISFALAVLSLFILWLSWLSFAPTGQSGEMRLVVCLGDNFSQVTKELERSGLLRSRRLFEQLANWRRLPSNLQAGIYRIKTPISLWRLTRLLSEKKPELIRLTVWEGMMAKEIAERVEQLGLGNAEKFMGIARNPEGRVRIPFPWQGDLEGVLFPATYLLPPLRQGNEAFIAQQMVNAFTERFWQPYRSEIEKSKFTLRELVTLASMVQWEVKVDDERPIVAGVILNRLKQGMKLEVDATALYALGQRKKRVLYRDLQVDSPYNTYRHDGLPPGPICSPGLPSLLAALRPADVPYLFYVAKGDGRHTFSSTYEEHLKAVATYRLLMQKQQKR